MRRNSGYIKQERHSPISEEEAKGVYDLHDQVNYQRKGSWPQTIRFTDCQASTLSASEGTQMNVTTTITGGVDGNTIPYRVITVSGTAMVDADFNGIVVSGGAGTISNNGTQMILTFTPVAGDGTESNTFRIEILDNDGAVAIKDNGFLCQTPTITLTDVAGIPHPSGQGGEVQWEIWAEEAAAGDFTSSTQIDTPWVDTSLSVDTWISASAVTKSSFTNSAGGTAYYLTLPTNCNFQTTSNSSSGTDMTTNGGFTFWIAYRAYTTQSNFTRPWFYRGIATSDGNVVSSTPSTLYQYTGPLMFVNSFNSRIQFRRPSGNTSNAAYAYITGMNFGNTITHTVVWSFNLSNGSSNYDHYSKDPATGTVYDDLVNQSITWSGNATYGVKNSDGTGRPFFQDSIYTRDYTPDFKLMSSGWINTECTAAERAALIAELKSRYT